MESQLSRNVCSSAFLSQSFEYFSSAFVPLLRFNYCSFRDEARPISLHPSSLLAPYHRYSSSPLCRDYVELLHRCNAACLQPHDGYAPPRFKFDGYGALLRLWLTDMESGLHLREQGEGLRPRFRPTNVPGQHLSSRRSSPGECFLF